MNKYFYCYSGVSDLLITIETKLISLAIQSNSWANILAQVIFESKRFVRLICFSGQLINYLI
jgi:hypothetical protein